MLGFGRIQIEIMNLISFAEQSLDEDRAEETASSGDHDVPVQLSAPG